MRPQKLAEDRRDLQKPAATYSPALRGLAPRCQTPRGSGDFKANFSSLFRASGAQFQLTFPSFWPISAAWRRAAKHEEDLAISRPISAHFSEPLAGNFSSLFQASGPSLLRGAAQPKTRRILRFLARFQFTFRASAWRRPTKYEQDGAISNCLLYTSDAADD